MGRYLLRYRISGRFFWDDAAHGLALAAMLGTCGLYTHTMWFTKVVKGHGSSFAAPIPETEYIWFLKIELALSILFWICIYAVKLAFLLLYRMLFVVSTWSNRIWWGISVFTLLTFWVCVASELTICGPSKNLFRLGKYC